MHPIKTLVVSATLGIFLCAITGAALADPGKGNPNAPGQQQAVAAASTPKPAAPTTKGKGQGKSASSHQTANSSPTTAGMKPANNTAKGTHCSTGGSAGAATCTATGTNTAQAQAKTDASKRYGNGQTAAQIAVSRGAPAGTDIYGPGNSQPHKVTDCKHPHGVDVHAVKSYSNAACAPTSQAPSKTEQQAQPSCPTPTTKTVVTGVWHRTGSKSNPMVLIHPSSKSAHMSKHSDDAVVTQTVTSTAAGQSCASQSNTTTSTSAGNAITAVATPTAAAAGTLAAAGVKAAQAGVLGAQASKSGAGAAGKLASSKAKPSRSGGVLGASGRAAHALGAVATRGKLPFTGFPLWAAALIGLGLVATGATLRRYGRAVV